MIEPQGARYAYVVAILDVADSDDEAFGRAMHAAKLFYPESKGWSHHFVVTQRISGIAKIGRANLERIEPAPCPT